MQVKRNERSEIVRAPGTRLEFVSCADYGAMDVMAITARLSLRPVLSFSHAAPPPRPSKTPAKLVKRMSRRWRVVLLRARGKIIQTVEAPDVAAAKAAAAVQFELDDFQRSRIIVEE